MEDFFEQYTCPFDSEYVLILEADSRTFYAYLLHNQEVVADVWISNIGEDPQLEDFSDPEKMPFKNPIEYLKVSLGRLTNLDPININWIEGESLGVSVQFENGLTVLLKPGSFPGWSNGVVKDGPLALGLKD